VFIPKTTRDDVMNCCVVSNWFWNEKYIGFSPSGIMVIENDKIIIANRTAAAALCLSIFLP